MARRDKCSKCRGTGSYQYDHNHSTVCNACCIHKWGEFLLTRHHMGHAKGRIRYACDGGCGAVVELIDKGGMKVYEPNQS